MKTDQELAQAIYDAAFELERAATVAKEAGLNVKITTYVIPDCDDKFAMPAQIVVAEVVRPLPRRDPSVA